MNQATNVRSFSRKQVWSFARLTNYPNHLLKGEPLKPHNVFGETLFKFFDYSGVPA